MPLKVDETILLLVNNQDDASSQVPVSTLPNAIQVEFEILDDIRQKLADAYHVYNQMELCMIAQQSRIQQVYKEFANQEEKET